jgi:hypothetical protein
MTKVYIAGPITGVKGYADRFKRAEQILEEAGHEPVSPVIPEKYEGRPYRSYIDRGLRLLMGCDAICMLPGWTRSRGAMLEKRYAETVKLPVYFIDTKYEAVRGPLL